jgi:protocatechuate 3,4-dioxygenase beta subunit
MASARLGVRLRRVLTVAGLVLLVALGLSVRAASASTGSISGTIFDDLNNNGYMDSNEVAQGSLTVFIDSDHSGAYNVGDQTVTADGTGAFSFTNVANGTYQLGVIPPTGYGATNSLLTVNVNNGANVQNANLGVSNLGAVSGTVFNDVNGNGNLDTGDAGVSGKSVYIDTNGSGNYTTGEPQTTTDASGNFSFSGLSTSTAVSIRLVTPAGSQQTSPLPGPITPSAGQTVSGVTFGLFVQNTITGTVYNDVNANGTKDPGDSGITTKTVFLDVNGNGTKDVNELTATTNASGVYTFTGIGPGTFAPRLVVASNIQQTSNDPNDITTTSGSTWSGNDFGSFTLASISGTVFNDLNANGVKDTSEGGLTGKTVYIDTNNNGQLDSGEPNQQTNGTGGYTFSNLGPGTYQVRAVAPTNSTATSGDPAPLTMTSGALNAGTNIGYYLAATISGEVYNDTNGNGALTAGEGGVSGVTAYIDTNGNGSVDTGEPTSVTDSGGHYSFANLTPGTYKVRIVVPATYMQTSTNPTPITPTSGSTTTANVGIFQLATIGGTVYDDVSGNGQKDTGDLGVSGVTVFLDTNGNSQFDLGEASAVTDSNGAWTVTGLTPGSYKPRIVTPTGNTLTTTLPATITATSGLNSTSSNFGLFAAASISGSVYGDFDGNGARDAGEAGLAGKTIFLDTNGDGALSSGEPTATTDASGNYTFTGLGPGIYRPRLNVPSGMVQTTTNVLQVVTSSGSATTGIDFGAFTTASISGTIYNDVNGDGAKQGGDAGLAQRTVYIDTNGNGSKDTNEPAITTGTGGPYSFTNLGPGTYQVRVVVPAGSIQTSVNPAPITTTSGSASGGNDFGLYQYGSISGTVYNDVNGNGTKGTTELGLNGRTVYLDANNNNTFDAGEVSTTTSTSGQYTFTGLVAGTYNVKVLAVNGSMQTSTDPAPIIVGSNATITGTDFGIFALASVSGQIYQDSNGNGNKNLPDDTGMAGLTVFLDQNSNGQIDTGEPTTLTDAAGNYGFANLPPATYRPRVQIPTTDTVTTATLPTVTTASGTTSTGNDIGVFVDGTISGTVFNDVNGNGTQDTGEFGVAGVRVYSDTNGNNQYTAGEPTVMTDANGNFTLSGLKVGTYKPRIVAPTGDITSTATPASISVVSSTASTGVNFGLFVPGTINGSVFNDTNGNGVRDNGETLLSGKTVYLDANNDGVKQSTEASVTTTTQGTYAFSNLGSGTYYVRLVLPTGQTQTTTNPAAIVMTSGLATNSLDFGMRTTPVTTGGGTTTTTPVVVPPPAPSQDAVSQDTGYWMTNTGGDVFAYGSAPDLGEASTSHPTAPVVGLAPTTTNKGYYQVSSDGGIFAFGDAKFYGSMGGQKLNQPMVGMAVTPTGNGYWTVATDGGVFSYGDAKFFGSTGSIKLNKPIVAIQPTSTGKGYWLVASDGGIFAYGDAKFFGSTGSMRLNKPIVGMARAAGDAGYWLVASDGGIFAFGTAPFYGSMGSKALNQPIVSIHAPASGDGYWMFARDGGVFAYGSAQYFGGTPTTPTPIIE